MLKNTRDNFGSITKFAHWTIFLLVTIQFYLVWGKNLIPRSVISFPYVLAHKTLGLCILIIGIGFILWHVINLKPKHVLFQPYWQQYLARVVHFLLFALIIIMPCLGYLMGCAAGKPLLFFGVLKVPAILAPNKLLGELLYKYHVYLGYLFFGIIILHISAALYHHVILKDRILKRILPGRNKEQL